MHPTHSLIPTQACATRDADGNAPLHFALVRCAAAGLDTTVRKTDGEPGKGRFKRVLVARLLASAAAARTVRDVSPDASPRAVACV